MSEQTFPVAQVITANAPWYTRVSRMWIATALCIALAVGLTWYSLESPGTMITIRFPEGHGLKPGDVLRHRGIEIGEVRKIELSESLDAVTVHAELVPSASTIACDGSRFWIVRPQLDLTGISGLETAVGAKFIAVAPGDSKLKKVQFDGLGSPPPDGLRHAGIELVLRGEQRFGVSPGSPLTWRGVEVGTVLSSGLSPDARHVDTSVQVFDPYRRLVSRDSKFWVTSGFDLELGMTGFELSADSLAAIARGGIGFITPQGDGDDEQVQPGDVFTLHEKVDQGWIASASAVNLLSRELPEVGRIEAAWKQKKFGFTRSALATASALLVKDDGLSVVLAPADLSVIPTEAIEGTFQLVYISPSAELTLEPTAAEAPVAGETRVQDSRIRQIARLPVDSNLTPVTGGIAVDRIRIPVSPEDCFAVRSSWHSEQDSAVVIEMIGKDELRADDGFWVVSNSNLNREIWHGAVVIASQDESMIGMLVVVDDLPTIVPASPLDVPASTN